MYDAYPGLTGDARMKAVRRSILEEHVQAFAGPIENIESMSDADLYGIRDRVRIDCGWKITEAEQIAICKILAVKSMWGHGWVGHAIVEALDEKGPLGPRMWSHVYDENAKAAQRESVGVITTQEELDRYLKPSELWRSGGAYHLTNFDEDGCSLFYPPPMNGLCKYVSKELADKYRQRYDINYTHTAPAT